MILVDKLCRIFQFKHCTIISLFGTREIQRIRISIQALYDYKTFARYLKDQGSIISIQALYDYKKAQEKAAELRNANFNSSIVRL